jgi:hypothetical protein
MVISMQTNGIRAAHPQPLKTSQLLESSKTCL